MSQIEHGIECTPVTDASMSVSKTSTRYALTSFFFFFTFLIYLGQIFTFSYFNNRFKGTLMHILKSTDIFVFT